MWEFSIKSGWQEIEDFLAAQGTDDIQKELELAGYQPNASSRFGDEFSGFSADVYGPSLANYSAKMKYRYLVFVEVGGVGEYVAVPALPDLIELVAKVSSISELAVTASERLEAQRARA